MQRHGESKEAPVGFANFDHGKPHIHVKSTACSRPVVHGQDGAEQQQPRTHVRTGHPFYPLRSTISAGTGTAAPRSELQQVGCAASLRPPHGWAARFPPALTAKLTRCRCLPPPASLPPSPALPSLLSHLHTQLNGRRRSHSLTARCG